jgi:DNA-binding Lrp family transcriptional regulator
MPGLKKSLDEIDEKIIKSLQENSRASIADMARDIGKLTENAIRYRIDKLEAGGYISNYTIELNPKKFGKNVMAIINLNVKPENIEDTLNYLKSIVNLTEVYLTTGNFSIIAIGYFEDNNGVTHFITEHLKNVKIIDYEMTTVLNKIKHEMYGI